MIGVRLHRLLWSFAPFPLIIVLACWPCATHSPRVGLAAQTIKDPLRGIISMGAYNFGLNSEPVNTISPVSQKAGLLQGIVLIATWRNLEPTATSGLAADNEIDQGLAAVRKYNQQNPTAPLAVKIRVWGASWAPEWVMAASGGKFSVVHTNVNGKKEERPLGHVWSDAYRSAWAHLQQLLAAKYDSDPLIHEVAVTSCMMFTSEPFSIDTTPGALEPLRHNGLTDANYQTCLKGIVDDYSPWQATRFETPLNAYIGTDSGKPVKDVNFTLGWMADCEHRGGGRCVFDNHDLAVPVVTPELQTLYSAMKNSHSEVEFQTLQATPNNLRDVIASGVQLGASSIELYQDYGGFPSVPDSDLREYSSMLLKGPGGH